MYLRTFLTDPLFLSVNRLMEVPNDEVDGELRWKRFDATFCLLLHTYYTVNRMVSLNLGSIK